MHVSLSSAIALSIKIAKIFSWSLLCDMVFDEIKWGDILMNNVDHSSTLAIETTYLFFPLEITIVYLTLLSYINISIFKFFSDRDHLGMEQLSQQQSSRGFQNP